MDADQRTSPAGARNLLHREQTDQREQAGKKGTLPLAEIHLNLKASARIRFYDPPTEVNSREICTYLQEPKYAHRRLRVIQAARKLAILQWEFEPSGYGNVSATWRGLLGRGVSDRMSCRELLERDRSYCDINQLSEMVSRNERVTIAAWQPGSYNLLQQAAAALRGTWKGLQQPPPSGFELPYDES